MQRVGLGFLLRYLQSTHTGGCRLGGAEGRPPPHRATVSRPRGSENTNDLVWLPQDIASATLAPRLWGLPSGGLSPSSATVTLPLPRATASGSLCGRALSPTTLAGAGGSSRWTDTQRL